jgi:hypothetical protein
VGRCEDTVSKSRAKGTAAESAVVRYLNDNGFPYADRAPLRGNADKGDITGIPGFVCEVKNCARMELAGWVDELDVEMRNAGVTLGAVVHKRRGKGDPGQWFATMPLEVLARLLGDAS